MGQVNRDRLLKIARKRKAEEAPAISEEKRSKKKHEGASKRQSSPSSDTVVEVEPPTLAIPGPKSVPTSATVSPRLATASEPWNTPEASKAGSSAPGGPQRLRELLSSAVLPVDRERGRAQSSSAVVAGLAAGLYEVLLGALVMEDLASSSDQQMEALKKQLAELTEQNSSAQAKIFELEDELAVKTAGLRDAEAISAQQKKEIAELQTAVEAAESETKLTIEAYKGQLEVAGKKAVDDYKESEEYRDQLAEECFSVHLDGFQECKEMIEKSLPYFDSSILVSSLVKGTEEEASPATDVTTAPPAADEPQV